MGDLRTKVMRILRKCINVFLNFGFYLLFLYILTKNGGSTNKSSENIGKVH